MRATLANKAYEQIKSDIITCTYEPGQQIAQPQLVGKYQIGITPIREALQRLAQEGFLRPIPRFGYVVIPISIPDVHQIYELRAILEPAAAYIDAKNASQEDLEQLVKNAGFSYIPGDRQAIVDFVNNNAKFHLSVAIVTGNRRLVEATSKLLDEMARIFHMVYAGFWIRVGAKIIDGIVLSVVGFALDFLGSFVASNAVAGSVIHNILSVVLSIGYTTYFLGAYSATPGKMACGLKVVRPDGEKISYARACGRFFAELVSSLILGIGYLMVIFDAEKLALHDRICDTRVVKKA